MKKIINILIAIIFIGIAINQGKAQLTYSENSYSTVPYINKLCYKTTILHRINVDDQINLSTLDTRDKLNFVKKSLVESHTEYIDQTGNYSIETEYINDDNYYPKWFLNPDRTLVNSTGISTYYDRTSKYYSGGWPGYNTQTNDYGTFYEDPRTGEKSFVHSYTNDQQLDFTQTETNLNKFGVLFGKVFMMPDVDVLRIYQGEGYTTYSNSVKAVATSTYIEINWDAVEKTISIIYSDNNGVTAVNTYYYEYSTPLQTNILSRAEEIIPSNFSNGDCFDHVTITYFTNYSLCGGSIMIRNSKPEEETISGLIIEPNPANNFLNVSFPKSQGDSFIEVLSMSGKVMLSENLNFGVDFHTLDIQGLVSGLYIVQITQNDQKYSKKFVKQ